MGVHRRFPMSTKIKVGATFGIGILVGGSGLATAGALPAPAQNVAHTVLWSVAVDLPGGPQRYNGPECRGTYKNHGQYVRAHKNDPNAGKSRCGKPIQAGTGSDSADAPDTTDNPSGAPPGKGQGNTKSHGHPGKGDDGQSPDSAGTGSTPQAPVAPSSRTTTTTTSTTLG
jgi:hypothetical protein